MCCSLCVECPFLTFYTWLTCNYALGLISSRSLLLQELSLISLHFDLGPSLVRARPRPSLQDVFKAVEPASGTCLLLSDSESIEAETISFASVSPTACPNKASLSRRSKKWTDLNEDRDETCLFPSLCSRITRPHQSPTVLVFLNVFSCWGSTFPRTWC